MPDNSEEKVGLYMAIVLALPMGFKSRLDSNGPCELPVTDPCTIHLLQRQANHLLSPDPNSRRPNCGLNISGSFIPPAESVTDDKGKW